MELPIALGVLTNLSSAKRGMGVSGRSYCLCTVFGNDPGYLEGGWVATRVQVDDKLDK